MKTRYEQMTSNGIDSYSNFLGNDDDYQTWFGVVGQSRDSEALERSNFRVTLERLGGESKTVRVERYGHWACGWIEEIYVKPGSVAYTDAIKIEAALQNYPVLDDDDFYTEEREEALNIWKNCFDNKERIQYIRENYSQFEFDNIIDMMQCARGDFFCGYESELIIG